MSDKAQEIQQQTIENRIFTIRGVQVMLDSHLAEMYGVDTKVLNQAVKRNKERFPEQFMFQITEVEFENLRSQFATSSSESLRSQFVTSSSSTKHGGRRYLPYVFTEQGIAMLSAVLRSETAVMVSIQIMNAFVQMRKFISDNASIFHRLDRLEHRQIESEVKSEQRQIESEEKFERVFRALESHEVKQEKGIFFDGQMFDAYSFVSDLIRSAEKSIIVIDNYIDESVLLLLTKRNEGVKAVIYTKVNRVLELDVAKHNSQYEPIALKDFALSHDRFLIVDERELYHIGASLKDLGKKWFAFSKMEAEAFSVLNKLQVIV